MSALVAALAAAVAFAAAGCRIEARDETRAKGLPDYQLELARGWTKPSRAEAQLAETIARLRIQGQEGNAPEAFEYKLLGFHRSGGVPEAVSLDALIERLRNDPSLPEFARITQGSLRETTNVVEEFTRLERTSLAGEPAVYYDYIEEDADRRLGHRIVQTIHGRGGLTLNLKAPANQLHRFYGDLDEMIESWKWKDGARR